MKKISLNSGNRQAGFSLVEIMVGMVISLLGIIIIFQVFAVSERVKRTTTSGGDAQQNGVAALFALARNLKMAGYGLNSNDLNPWPLLITPGALVSNPDSFVTTYRANWDFGPFLPSNLVFPAATPPALTQETIFINNNAQLMSDNGTPADITDDIEVADGIVQLKVQYGTDANGNGIVEPAEWVATAPANPMTVLAVRLALVARSSQPEGKCNSTSAASTWTTTATPTWAGGALDLTGNVGLAAGDDWKCYRYKTFSVTVPMRNVIWRP